VAGGKVGCLSNAAAAAAAAAATATAATAPADRANGRHSW